MDPIVESVPLEHHARIAGIVARWCDDARSTERITRDRAAAAIAAVYTVADLRPPHVFVRYPSPRAAWDAAADWLPRIGGCGTQYWSYQLPLADPSAYWMACGPKGDVVDLAVARWRNEQGALVYGRPVTHEKGHRVTRAVIHELFAETASAGRRDAYFALARTAPQPLGEALERRLYADMPSCPIEHEEFTTLGPLAWAVREAACLEIAHDVLGCRINHAHLAAIGAMVSECGYVMAFRHLAVLCDRPTEFVWSGHEVRMRFADGTTEAFDVEDPSP